MPLQTPLLCSPSDPPEAHEGLVQPASTVGDACPHDTQHDTWPTEVMPPVGHSPPTEMPLPCARGAGPA